MEQLGQRVIAARQGKRLSRRALAGLAGLHETHLEKVERDKRPHLEADTVVKLARALECTTDYLLGLAPTPEKPCG